MIDWKIEAGSWKSAIVLTDKQFPYAVAGTLTNMAIQARQAEKSEMRRVFHDPSGFVLNSIIFRAAKVSGDQILPAAVLINPQAPRYVAPTNVLQAEIEGGSRLFKGSENLLHDSPLLAQSHLLQGQNEQEWVPGAKMPLTSGGDAQGGELRRIVSAFQAAKDVKGKTNSRIKGFTGITAREHARIVLGPTSKEERILTSKQRVEQRIASVQQKKNRFNYLVGEGNGGGAPRIVYSFDWIPYDHKFADGTTMTLFKKGNFRPVLYFTKIQHYQKRLDFYGVAEQVAVSRGKQIFEDVAAKLFNKWTR